MSLSRGRVRSASMANRCGVINADVVMLQDTVIQLQQQLVHTRNETKKVKDQLNCLITLVKQAWTGDRTAVLHVANIAGVAAPDITQDFGQDEKHVVVTAKSRAINNWARLTIGLWNREYCYLERDIEDRQRHYLLSRESFLSRQVEKGYERPINHNNWQIVQPISQPPPSPVMNGHGPPSTPAPNTSPEQPVHPKSRKPTVRHLYRPASMKEERTHHNANMALADPNHYDSRDCLLTKLNKTSSTDNRNGISYIDKQRYNQYGLFNEESVLGSDAMKRRRPTSCIKDQRHSDTMRARPRSAVLPKGERPLKFETTRPVSCNVKRDRGLSRGGPGPMAFGRRSSTGDLIMRPQADKATEKTFLTREQDENTDLQQLVQPPQNSPHGSEDEEEEEEEEWMIRDRAQRRREAETIMVQIKKPNSVIKFEGDLAHMNKMQDDFKLKTIELQKKLGISPEGLVL